MSLIKFPGLIDCHVHLREPGATYKENFETGSKAAVGGGFTFILDMPNNPKPTISIEALEEKISLSKQKAICDIGFYFGTNGKNMDQFEKAWENPNVFGLKIYMNHTTGDLLIENIKILEKIFNAWKSDKPILVHAEEDKLDLAIELAKKFDRRLHACHLSRAEEVKMVKKAKATGLKITAGVTPHHLFLTEVEVERLEGFAIMRPPLGSQDDQNALWQAIKDKTIDIVETDHAPHTKEEKMSANPPSGIPGLETALGLLIKAVNKGNLTLDDVKRLLYDNPKKIFNIPDQPDTYIEFDPEKPYIIGSNSYATKCDWSSFEGSQAFGKIEKVVIRGNQI